MKAKATSESPKKKRDRGMRGRGTVIERNGFYEAQVSAGTDERGKRVRLTAVAKTIEEAQLALAKLILDGKKARGRPRTAGKRTLAAYLDSWLIEVAGRRRPSTIEYYGDKIRAHIKPNVGDVQLGRFGPEHCERLYAAMAKDSPSSRRKAHMVLRAALADAYRRGLITENPMLRVEPPRYKAERMRVLDVDEASLFIKAVKGDPLELLYLFAIYAGARQAEIFDLLWEDVDLTTKMAAIRDSKTAAGRRSVPLDPPVLALLKAVPKKSRSGLVFPNAAGGRMRRQNFLRRDFYPILARIDADLKEADPQAGFPKIRFHDLRHTCATLLLKAGVHPKVVQERLGHASVQITLDTYSHVLPGMQAQASKAMASLLDRQARLADRKVGAKADKEKTLTL